MRLLAKLVLIAALFALILHFFSPQIDHLWAQVKERLTSFVTKHDDSVLANYQSEDKKYYKLEKRAQ